METKPLLIVQSCKPISSEKAYRAIAKFVHQETTGTSGVPDDVTSKLTTLEAELRSLLDSDAGKVLAADGSAKKKRKKEFEGDEGVEKKAKKEKKEKKDKKDKSRSEIVPVDINQVTKSSKPADNALANMKKAVSKMK